MTNQIKVFWFIVATLNCFKQFVMKESLGFSDSSSKVDSHYQVIADLLQRVAKKDTAALNSLYDLTSSQVYGLIYQLVKDTALAEEVLSDTYLYVWHNANNYNQQRGKPITWLLILARSRAFDKLRRDKERKLRTQNISLTDNNTVTNLESNAPSPEKTLFDSERQKSVQSALKQLPSEQREVIELAYYSGFSHQEIAQETNQPVGTVKTRIRIGTGKLKELLKPLIEDQI